MQQPTNSYSCGWRTGGYLLFLSARQSLCQHVFCSDRPVISTVLGSYKVTLLAVLFNSNIALVLSSQPGGTTKYIL
jgi:hypothetical protein